jgi:hypothetical protein
MLAAEKSENWRPAVNEFVHRNGEADIAAGKLEARLQGFDGFITAAGGGVDLSKVQIKLSLIALHADSGIAELFRFAPFLFGASQDDTQVRHVVRVVLVEVHRATHVRKSFVGIVIAKKRQTSLKFTESFSIEHVVHLTGTSREIGNALRGAAESGAALGREKAKRNAPVIHTMIGAVRSRSARKVPIPVLLEGKGMERKNLLTGGPVLGQPD